MMKLCAKCRVEFTYEGSGNRSYCTPCKIEYHREWRKNNPDAVKRYKKKWEQANPEKVKDAKRAEYHRNRDRALAYRRKREEDYPEIYARHRERVREKGRAGRYAYHRHGITPAQRVAIELAQGHVCPLCNTPLRDIKRPSVDHDHSTGLIRGILCNKCNSWLGWYENRLELVGAYLSKVHYRPARWSMPGRRHYGSWGTSVRPSDRTAYSAYGITPEQRELISSDQGHACYLCGTALVSSQCTRLDRDTRTGLLRGLLCRTCSIRLSWYERHAEPIRAYLAGPRYRPARWDEAG